MENATNALLMAGGILIALLILGALIMMFTNLQSYQNTNDYVTKNAQVAEFNNQFNPYNKDGLTLMEIKSVYNKIESNNRQYPLYKIDTNIQDGLIRDVISKEGNVAEDEWEKFFTNFRDLEDKLKQNLRFRCDRIEYKGLEGRINLMNFTKSN